MPFSSQTGNLESVSLTKMTNMTKSIFNFLQIQNYNANRDCFFPVTFLVFDDFKQDLHT